MMRSFLMAAVMCGLVFPAAAQTPPRAVPQSPAQVQLSFAPVVAKVTPAVVNVYARRVVRAQANPFAGDPFFQQFFGMGPMRDRVEQSLGSGVIVRSDGIILTNNHVIEGGQDIKIALSDRREYSAKVLLADARTDLAVLKVDTKGERLPALDFGDSDKIQVGDLVLAIGDPFGVGQTVTSGIVSALARNNGGSSDYQFFIQTDAAINPGNSGGALVTMDGRLVGINSSIVSQSGGNIGIGFAIPVNIAKLVVQSAVTGGATAVRLPWFGADGQAVTSDIAAGLGLARPSGVVINQVYPGSPAAQAGIAKGDVILSVDNFETNDPQALRYRVATHPAGAVVPVKFIRAGQTRSVNVTLALPPDTDREETTITGANPMQGAKVANITPALADSMQIGFSQVGVVVTRVSDNSQAARFGFQEGDIVRSINGARIANVSALKSALSSSRGWNMDILRDGQTLNLSVR